MKNGTLARRLFVRIAPSILIIIAVIGFFAYRSATREINNVYDAQLINNANVLWILVQDEFREAGADVPKKIEDIDLNLNNQRALNQDADDYAEARMFRIWKSAKLMMFSSTAMPESTPQRTPGFSQVQYKNEKWRIYTLVIPKTPISIEVGEKQSLRDTLVTEILLDLAVPLGILVPIIGFLIWLGIGSGIGSVRALVAQIRNRSPEDLSRISVDNLPHDLSPLGQSINQLLSKLSHSLTAERRFADYAAHQLRTPLAGVKLQLQMLAGATNDNERSVLVSGMSRSTDRATHLVEQLLRAARVGHQPISLGPVSLYHVTAAAIADEETVATQKRLDIALQDNEEATVLADETLMKLAISNLIDNAVKYTPDSGKISVNIFPREGAWCLSICDTGPGIPEGERESVFKRFYRLENAGIEGTGLGLTIVSDIIKRFSGTISLKSPRTGQGLLVEVCVPKI